LFDDVELIKLINNEKGSIELYRACNEYYAKKNRYVSFFKKNEFYHRRNLAIVDILKDINNPKIFEFAATYGFLASQISKKINFNKYTTSNFLPEAVSEMNSQITDDRIKVIEFDANDIIGSDLREYDTFICTSLEHLEHDIDIIKALPSGCNFVFSVPNFHDPTHVRVFKHEQEIIYRYGDILDIEKIEVIKEGSLKKFVVKSTKKI
jgi:hypothetical protein